MCCWSYIYALNIVTGDKTWLLEGQFTWILLLVATNCFKGKFYQYTSTSLCNQSCFIVVLKRSYTCTFLKNNKVYGFPMFRADPEPSQFFFSMNKFFFTNYLLRVWELKMLRGVLWGIWLWMWCRRWWPNYLQKTQICWFGICMDNLY